MNRPQSGPIWQQPKGVSEGNWQYINDPTIAQGYDESLKNSPLITIDQKVIETHIPSNPGMAIDFGCGTGRNAIPVAKLGWSVMGLDLSRPMLKNFQNKVSTDPEKGLAERVSLIQSNLLELDFLHDQIADFGQCMFSTFGMIRGKSNRKQFLSHVVRILKPGATFVVHAHNYWHNMTHPGGWKWMLGNLFQSCLGRSEIGERKADYRTVSQMTLHHFSSRALQREISSVGFLIQNLYAIYDDQQVQLSSGHKMGLNVVGWLLVAKTRN